MRIIQGNELIVVPFRPQHVGNIFNSTHHVRVEAKDPALGRSIRRGEQGKPSREVLQSGGVLQHAPGENAANVPRIREQAREDALSILQRALPLDRACQVRVRVQQRLLHRGSHCRLCDALAHRAGADVLC